MISRTRFTGAFWAVASILWALAAIGVWTWTTRYAFTTYPDDNTTTVEHWPDDTSLELATDRPTLLFFMHPRCPCTRASLHELERTLTGAGLSGKQRPKCVVVSSIPQNASSDWRETDTVRHASRLPDTEMVWDIVGVETKRFGAVTSGSVRLFDPNGDLLFAGGVTASRGHEGDNAGSDSVYAILSQRSTERQQSTPVFGCRLCIELGTPTSGQVCEVRAPTDRLGMEGAMQ